MALPTFGGFAAATCALYTPEKWSSMVHNLPRMRVKEQLDALCDAAAGPLQQALAQTARCTSDEIPNVVNHRRVESQGVFWIRDAQTRSALASFVEKIQLDQTLTLHLAAQDKHVGLAVILHRQGLWVGLRLAAGAAVDRQNLRRKCELSWQRPPLLEILAQLPASIRCGFGAVRQPAAALDADALGQLGAQLASQTEPLFVGADWSVDELETLGTDLPPAVGACLAQLLPLYRSIAWTRDNDLIEVGKHLQEEKAKKRAQARSFKKGDSVRLLRGAFAGKVGKVTGSASNGKTRILIGSLSVVVDGEDLI